MSGLPSSNAVKHSPYPAARGCGRTYVQIVQRLKPPFVRPSQSSSERRLCRLWFRRQLVLALGVRSCWHRRGAAHQRRATSPASQVFSYRVTGGTAMAVHTRRSPLPPPGLSHPGHRYHLSRPREGGYLRGSSWANRPAEWWVFEVGPRCLLAAVAQSTVGDRATGWIRSHSVPCGQVGSSLTWHLAGGRSPGVTGARQAMTRSYPNW